MSGESTSRSVSPPEEMERAFGDSAVCNRCGHRVPDYRVVAHFLHDTAAVRAYWAERGCFSVQTRVEGKPHRDGKRSHPHTVWCVRSNLVNGLPPSSGGVL